MGTHADSTLENAQKVAEQYQSRLWYHGNVDISQTQQVKEIFAKAVEEARFPLRGFVACAGVSDGGASVDFPIDRVRRLLEINVTGTFACAQAAASLMRQSNLSCSMVLIASMSGHVSNKVCHVPCGN